MKYRNLHLIGIGWVIAKEKDNGDIVALAESEIDDLVGALNENEVFFENYLNLTPKEDGRDS